jgi:glucose/mannose-6-phosphate isomerase
LSAAASLEPPYGQRDRRGMAALVDALPDHIEAALAASDVQPWAPPVAQPSLLALGGMGGSAIAGELTAALVADRAPRPFLIVRDYHWPACVDRTALAVLSSNSGNTEETLSLAHEAIARGVPCAAIASGGALAALAGEHGWPLHRLPAGMPPRAALFHGWVPLTRFVHRLGWASDPVPDWREAAALLARRRTELGAAAAEAANPAKRLARELAGRSVYLYSGPGGPAAVAVRWRQQLNENAKVLAHSSVVPEHNHNEIVGWQEKRPDSRSLAVLLLRDGEDTAAATARLDLTAEFAARQGAAVHEIRSQGESRIARLASLVQFGDSLSLYLALLGGVDPTDIASIDEFKRRLATRASAR